jgi:phage terminase large subunit-like protein
MDIAELSRQPKHVRDDLLNQLSPKERTALTRNWEFLGREWQHPPDGNWQFWIFLAGRGAGKTRAGAEWVRSKIKQLPRYSHIGLIAPTTDSARKVMVEGESGILKCCSVNDVDDVGNGMGRPLYEPSKRRLRWGNGSIATVYTAEEPERLRGPQHSALWCDELASWPRSKLRDGATEAWDNAMFGLRIGANPQAMISTTPKPIPIIR